MSYCAQADIEKEMSPVELVQFTNDAGGNTVDAAVLAAAIDKADQLIDSYVGKVKKVPLIPVPGIIKNLSTTMTIWNLFVRRGAANPVREAAYNSAVKTLQAIAGGQATLGDAGVDILPETTQGGPRSSTLGKDRNITTDTLGNL